MNAKRLLWMASLVPALLLGVWIGGQTYGPVAAAAPNVPADLCPENRVLTGVVYDCDGNPVPGVSVRILGWSTPAGAPYPNPATTDATGTYMITISGLPVSEYQVVATLPASGASVTQPDGDDFWDDCTSGDLVLDFGPVSNYVPCVCGPDSLLTGYVYDCDGNPVSGAIVEIVGWETSPGDPYPNPATTGSDGGYAISIAGLPVDSPSSSYQVIATYPNGSPNPPQTQQTAQIQKDECTTGDVQLNFAGTSCLPVTAAPRAAPVVYVPVVNSVAEQSGYETWIEVQNLGDAPTEVTLKLWRSHSGQCPPQSSSYFRLLRSPELVPGSSWVWTPSFIHSSARAGTLSASEPIAVEVVRRGHGLPDYNVKVTAAYAGLPETLLGRKDEVFNRFAYYAPIVYGSHAGLSSWLYIQNAGNKCTSVEIYFRSQESCNRTILGRIQALAPGESAQFDVAAAVGDKWQGSAWISASQPLAIAVDHFGDNVLMSYIAMPADTLYTGPRGNIPSSSGSQVNYGPLIYREYQGWDTTIHVQNLSSTTAAKAKVYFLDASGDVIKTLVDWICPRGTQDFFLPVVNGLPGNYVGAVRVESQDWWSPGDPPVPYPAIVSVAELSKYEGPARAERLEAIAYNLFTEDTAFDWQTGEFGVKVVGVPSLLKGADQLTSEIAIQNVTPLPGFTDLALFVYDQNGPLDFHCEKLNAKQVEYIDLNAWPIVTANFQGSMVISATYWNHAVPDQPGVTTAGIAAVSIQRSGTILGEDAPGDQSAGVEAFPVPAGFKFSSPSGLPPACPGQP
jgi:hypothetical protein